MLARSSRALALRVVLALAGALQVGACTEAPAGFVAVNRPAADPDSARLTYSTGDDRAPAWGAGDTIVYAAAGFDPYPPWPSLVLAISRDGGVAMPVFPSLYATLYNRSFVTPAPSPAGDRTAYVALDRFTDAMPCPAEMVRSPPSSTPVTAPRLPPLLAARLVVRSRAATGSENDDPQVGIRFAGTEESPGLEIPGVPTAVPRYLTRNYPFQQSYLGGGEPAFRPSWSPDGSTLVYGDGARLLVWRVGDPAPTALPGGAGLNAPAWSPNGDYIAATRAAVLDSLVRTFVYYGRFGIACAELRVDYVTGPSLIVLVARDGTVRDLAEGDEPAWAPDGSAVYVRRGSSSIWRVPVGGGTPVPVAGTGGGEEPALSRDGRYLAFTRLAGPGNHDLYVVRIAP